MLADKRISKYLLYATGEIILVVVGILIALQFNNMNTERKNRKTEQLYLSSFSSDLDKNIKELERVIAKSTGTYQAADSLIGYFVGMIEITDTLTLYQLIFRPRGFTVYQSAEGTVQDIMGSNQLVVIQNDTLRMAMASWASDLKNIREWEKLDQISQQHYSEMSSDYVDIYKGKFGGRILSDENLAKMSEDRDFLNSLSARISLPFQLCALYGRELERIRKLKKMTEGEIDN